MSFKENLRLIRKAKGMTQIVLGEETGVSNRCIQMWEKGEREPALSNILSLAKALDVSLEDLICRKAILSPNDKCKVIFIVD